MNRVSQKIGIVLVSAGLLSTASCESQDAKPDGKAEATSAQPMNSSASGSGGGRVTSVDVTPGEAGGFAEDTFTATVTVAAVDPATRAVTLTREDGGKATLICGPAVKNFDQIAVGDKVKVEVTERLHVFVRSETMEPDATRTAALITAPKGAKPGMIVGQSFEVTSTIKSIDTKTREAVLQFVDGQTRSVTVRPDVDLSRYKAGDTVVFRVGEAISLVTKAP